MITSDIGFWVDNYVGTYQIIESEGKKYIASKEFNPARNGEAELKKKRLFMDLFKNNEYILIQLANVDTKDENSIVRFCNEYGLPYSSSKIDDERPGCYIMGLDVDERTYSSLYPLYRQDNMQVYEFKRHVVSAQRILNVKSELESQSINYENLFRFLLPMLLYERYGFYDFDADDPERCTETMKFQYYFLNVLNKVGDKTIRSLACELFGFVVETQAIGKGENKVYVTDELRSLFQNEYPNELYKFLVDLIRYDNGQINEIKINEFNELQLPEGFHLSVETKKHLDELASNILSDIISESLQRVHPIMMVDENGKIASKWDLKYLYEGILVETLVMASGDNNLKKCANPNCGKFFTPNPGRNDKIYCSHTCGINVAKRRQRMRDKENPNRERLEPGFRNR